MGTAGLDGASPKGKGLPWLVGAPRGSSWEVSSPGARMVSRELSLPSALAINGSGRARIRVTSVVGRTGPGCQRASEGEFSPSIYLSVLRLLGVVVPVLGVRADAAPIQRETKALEVLSTGNHRPPE